jgi:hypothetical protein
MKRGNDASLPSFIEASMISWEDAMKFDRFKERMAWAIRPKTSPNQTTITPQF